MKGGARPGAGRPKGSNSFRKELYETLFVKDPTFKKAYFEKLRQKIERGDKTILTWLGDQMMGKAPQTVDMGMTDEFYEYVIKRGEDKGNYPVDSAQDTTTDTRPSG